jgi:lipoate-protein ligase A
MKRDEAMARACLNDGIPRVRLYTWDPWTLSLGYNQADDAATAEVLARRRYGLVRRPTGGRAVFHAEELTYAVAMRADGASVHQTYADISGALLEGLKAFGCRDIEFSRSQPDFRAHYEAEDSVSCFSASALNELAWRGRKLVGSAQRRYGPALLQHGSLLIGDAHLEIVDFLHSAAPETKRRILRERLASRTTTLREVLSTNQVSVPALADSLVTGFEASFHVELERADDVTLQLIETELA